MPFDKELYWKRRALPVQDQRALRKMEKLRTIQVLKCKRCKGTMGTLVNGVFLCNTCPGAA